MREKRLVLGWVAVCLLPLLLVASFLASRSLRLDPELREGMGADIEYLGPLPTRGWDALGGGALVEGVGETQAWLFRARPQSGSWGDRRPIYYEATDVFGVGYSVTQTEDVGKWLLATLALRRWLASPHFKAAAFVALLLVLVHTWRTRVRRGSAVVGGDPHPHSVGCGGEPIGGESTRSEGAHGSPSWLAAVRGSPISTAGAVGAVVLLFFGAVLLADGLADIPDRDPSILNRYIDVKEVTISGLLLVGAAAVTGFCLPLGRRSRRKKTVLKRSLVALLCAAALSLLMGVMGVRVDDPHWFTTNVHGKIPLYDGSYRDVELRARAVIQGFGDMIRDGRQ